MRAATKAELETARKSALWSGSSGALLHRRPLRTGQATHAAYGSSLSKASFNTRCSNLHYNFTIHITSLLACDTYQLLFEFASQRFKVTPSKLFLEQLDASLVMDFLAYIESQRGNSPRTRNIRLAAIKSFMRFMEHRVPSVLDQSLRILAIPAKKTDTPLISYLTKTEMEAILNAPDIRARSGIRDRAMLHLGFATGLRVSELTGLLLNAVTFQPTPMISVMGKGRKQRSLPLWKQTASDIGPDIPSTSIPPSQAQAADSRPKHWAQRWQSR